VYLTLTSMILMSGVGAAFQLYTQFSTTVSSLLCFVFLLGLGFSSFTGASTSKRLGLLTLFAFFEGASLGRLLDYAIRVDPSIITTALFFTTLVFVSFTLIAMLSPRRSFLYLGSYLSFTCLFMLFAGIINIFSRSSGMNWFLLYGGLVVFMTYVIYDTQIIIEKVSMGNADFVSHALELFIDFVAIFVRLVIILTKKKENERKN